MATPLRAHSPMPAHQPVAYTPITQHGDDDEPAQRPNRRRRAGGAQAAAAEPLQIVETSAPAPLAEPQLGDTLPRRTKPRRRRGAASESGPLMLVETQGGADAPQGDNPAQ